MVPWQYEFHEPEKIDLSYIYPTLLEWLEEDIRLDMDAFSRMNPEIIRQCAAIGKKKNGRICLTKAGDSWELFFMDSKMP